MSVFATYSTLRDTSSPPAMYLGISAPARSESVCPACLTPVQVGDRVVRAVVPGRCWVVHEGCAGFFSDD